MIAIIIVFYLAVNNGLGFEFNHNYSAVKLFQKYIQIDTTSNGDLSPAVEFWRKLAETENATFSVYEFVNGYPVVVIKWEGRDPSLSSVMLNSHMDVVPAAQEDGWKYPPFSAHIDDNGDIYGRGTQDMKCIAIQQFEALRRLKLKKVSLLRTVYMTLMPDEETGSSNGMVRFIKSKKFADMNVGVEMDEGWGQPFPDIITVFKQDKASWQFRVDCYGIAMHSSLFPPTNSTAVGKCLKVVQKLHGFRDEQYDTAKKDVLTNAGAFTNINLVMLYGGTAVNVIPGHVSFTFDVRLGTEVDEHMFLLQLNQWMEEAGDNVTLTFLQKMDQTPATIVDDSNPYWRVLTDIARKYNIKLNTITSTGATDANHLRTYGIPAFGLSPMMNTPIMAHKVNERLNVVEFLKGIAFYEEIVRGIANISASQVSNDPSVYVTRK